MSHPRTKAAADVSGAQRNQYETRLGADRSLFNHAKDFSIFLTTEGHFSRANFFFFNHLNLELRKDCSDLGGGQ